MFGALADVALTTAADTSPFGSEQPAPPRPRSKLDAELSRWEPGPVLGLMLSTLDPASLSAHDRVVVLRHHRRVASYYEAQLYAGMAGVAEAYEHLEPDPELAYDSAAAEVGAALHLTRQAAHTELSYAFDLRQRLPAVWHRLASGQIDARRAKTIVRGVEHLDPEVARAVVDHVFDMAPGLTTGQLAARLRKLCIDAAPDDAARRYDGAVAGRRVVMEPTTEGTANLLGMDLPPDLAAAAARHVDALAASLARGGDPRPRDQLRADVFLDLLQGNDPGGTSGRCGVVDIRIDLATLAGLDDSSADLAGYGPVLADIGRQVVERQQDGEWRFSVTHPGSGLPVHVGTTRRRPTAAQRRGVEARHPNCVFPGCRRPATECDLDHRIPWSRGGPTCECSMFPACRPHHVVKDGAGWSYEMLPDAEILWTSPLGHRYTTSGRAP